MSDAMCGPSNPLQQFKQQTSLDRTLQHDRLTSRHSPAQGFRSANPNAGHLDPEFEAFQAGVPPSDLQHFQPFQQPPQTYGGPAQAPSWASDFQQMHISSPPPFQQQYMPPQGPNASNWAQGFRDHVAQTNPRAQTSASSPQQFQQMARFGGMNGFQSGFSQQNMNQGFLLKGKEPVTEQFDEAAFERAFDQARGDMMGDEEMEDEEKMHDESAELTQANMPGQFDAPMSREDYQEQLMRLEQQNKKRLLLARMEQDQMTQLAESTHKSAFREYREQLSRLDESKFEPEELARLHAMEDAHQIREEAIEEQTKAQDRAKEDDDALAATAQELLEKVQHNQTDKFKNSQFLGLMRKLRDREVKVEGDQMVETNNSVATANTTAETQTSTLNSASPLRFDNTEQRPSPLGPQQANPVDTRPYEYGIPHEEQDHDIGRQQPFDPRDGQDVVDMLDQPGAVTDDIASYDPEAGERYGDSTNGTTSPYLMTRFPPGMRTVV